MIKAQKPGVEYIVDQGINYSSTFGRMLRNVLNDIVISAPGPSCPRRCRGECTVVLGRRIELPCDQNCTLGVQTVNTTWSKSADVVFVGSRERLVFPSTWKSRAGQYSRSHFIQNVGQCLTGVYTLKVTHRFREFITIFC